MRIFMPIRGERRRSPWDPSSRARCGRPIVQRRPGFHVTDGVLTLKIFGPSIIDVGGTYGFLGEFFGTDASDPFEIFHAFGSGYDDEGDWVVS